MTDFPDLQPWPPFPLASGCSWWRLEFICDGTPFVWQGEAANASAAETVARGWLDRRHPSFVPARARLAVCIEGA